MTSPSDTPETPLRDLGISVMPAYLQSEGLERVLENLVHKARATAVTFYPRLQEQCADGEGVRHPPHDGDAGHVRLFDRPVWGLREFWARGISSHAPVLSWRQGLRYQPSPPGHLTTTQGPLVQEFLTAAKQAGLKVTVQVPITIPSREGQNGQPGPAEDDLPRLPDGRVPDMQVDRFGSLASEDILAYSAALLVDLARAYPQLDGIRLDWPELPPYTVDTVFCDFSPHAQYAAEELGFDFERMRRDAAAAYSFLHSGLDTALLDGLASLPGADTAGVPPWLGAALTRWPGLTEVFAFKRALMLRLLGRMRAALDAAGAQQVGLVPQGFPAPWNALSGFDYAGAAPLSSGMGVKLYTMHWPMMVRYYSAALCAANPGLREEDLVPHLVRACDLVDAGEPVDPARFTYPDPDAPHPVSSGAVTRKVRAALIASRQGGGTPLYALTHSYGPLADFQRRMRATLAAGADRVWLQRYAYLSDEKLDWLGTLPRA